MSADLPPTSRRGITTLPAAALAIGGLLMALISPPAAAQDLQPASVLAPAEVGRVELSDDLAVEIPGVALIADDEEDPTATSLAISRATFLRADRVLVARADVFVDALASGVLQGGPAPLLLVAPDQPIRDDVRIHLASLEASEVILLGGEGALQPVVAESLADLGLSVRRVAGAERTTTAVAIAELADTGSQTALLARAFAAPGAGDPSQAWADSLAAGAWSAGTGHPVLLTTSDVLSPATRDHLVDGGYTTVRVIGGTAAIGEEVLAALRGLGLAVDRVAGPSRVETSLAIAEAWDAETGTVGGAAVTVGQLPEDWTLGLPLAATAAARDLRVLVAPRTGELPPAIAARLVPARPRTRQQPEATSPTIAGLMAGLIAEVVLAAGPQPRPVRFDADSSPVDEVDPEGFIGVLAAGTAGTGLLDVLVVDAAGGRQRCGPFAVDGLDSDEGTVYALSLPSITQSGCPPVPTDGLIAIAAQLPGGEGIPVDVDVIFELGAGVGDPLLAAAGTASGAFTRIEVLRGETAIDAPVTQEQFDVPRIGGRIDTIGGGGIVLGTDDRGPDLPGLVRFAAPLGGGQVADPDVEHLWTGMDGGLVTNPSVSPDGDAVAFSFSHLPSSVTPEFVGAIAVDGSASGQVTVVDADGFGVINDQAWQNGAGFVYWAGGEGAEGRDQIRRALARGFQPDGTPVEAGSTVLVAAGAEPAAARTGVIDLARPGGPDLARLIDTDSGARGSVLTFGDDAIAASPPTFSPTGEAFAQVRYDASGEARLVIVAMDLTILAEVPLPASEGLAPTGQSTSPEWGPYQAIAVPGAQGVILVGATDDGSVFEVVAYPSDRAPIQDVSWFPRILDEVARL